MQVLDWEGRWSWLAEWWRLHCFHDGLLKRIPPNCSAADQQRCKHGHPNSRRPRLLESSCLWRQNINFQVVGRGIQDSSQFLHLGDPYDFAWPCGDGRADRDGRLPENYRRNDLRGNDWASLVSNCKSSSNKFFNQLSARLHVGKRQWNYLRLLKSHLWMKQVLDFQSSSWL